MYCIFTSNICLVVAKLFCIGYFYDPTCVCVLMLFKRYLCAMNLTDLIRNKCDYLKNFLKQYLRI